MKRLFHHFILASLVLSFPAAAPAQDCLDCHDDSVDESVFAKSVHRASGDTVTEACLSCHEGVEVVDDEHEPPGPVDCSQCHDDEQSEYRASFHGKSRHEHVASCVDCHGSHGILGHLDPASRTYRLNQAEMCASCHSDPKSGFAPDEILKVKEYFRSIHGLAISRSGLVVSATCVDCHGSHDISEICFDCRGEVRASIPDLCGKCHVKAAREYRVSVHGGPLAQGNLDVPVCVDCHTSHQIHSHFEPESSIYPTHVSETCLKCHEDARFLDQYGFPPLRKETWLKSYHGAASQLGDTGVANCGSCHGSHLILPSRDPRAKTHPGNMKTTCGQCHETGDPGKPMTVGKIHVTAPQEGHWLTQLVEQVYVVLITATMAFFLFMIAIDLRKRFSNKP